MSWQKKEHSNPARSKEKECMVFAHGWLRQAGEPYLVADGPRDVKRSPFPFIRNNLRHVVRPMVQGQQEGSLSLLIVA